MEKRMVFLPRKIYAMLIVNSNSKIDPVADGEGIASPTLGAHEWRQSVYGEQHRKRAPVVTVELLGRKRQQERDDRIFFHLKVSIECSVVRFEGGQHEVQRGELGRFSHLRWEGQGAERLDDFVRPTV